MRLSASVFRRSLAWRGMFSLRYAGFRAAAPGSALAALAPVAVDAPRISDEEQEERAVPRIRRMLRALARSWNTGAWVALLASTASVASYVYYVQQGLTLAYPDSISHMMIARRVFASSHPGLAQLGTVWLPLNHILMLPFVWNDTLFHDGFA
ncbi:MAG TPA: hypothetical protein VF040_20905, partial [Ktedonobacterales bacterium]